MLFGGKPKPKPKPDNREAGQERRSQPRYQTAVVTCVLGELRDISRSGMRVHCVGVPRVAKNQAVEVELRSPSESLTVAARALRVQKLGSGRWEIGFEFIDVPAATADKIENLAKYGLTRGAVSREATENRRRLVAALRVPDHYRVLGVSPKATAGEIQAAFRQLARRYHPDLCREAGADRLFCQINAANEVLSDQQRREQYDRVAGHAAA